MACKLTLANFPENFPEFYNSVTPSPTPLLRLHSGDEVVRRKTKLRLPPSKFMALPQWKKGKSVHALVIVQLYVLELCLVLSVVLIKEGKLKGCVYSLLVKDTNRTWCTKWCLFCQIGSCNPGLLEAAILVIVAEKQTCSSGVIYRWIPCVLVSRDRS